MKFCTVLTLHITIHRKKVLWKITDYNYDTFCPFLAVGQTVDNMVTCLLLKCGYEDISKKLKKYTEYTEREGSVARDVQVQACTPEWNSRLST